MPPNIPAPLSLRRRAELRQCAETAANARRALEVAREQEKAGLKHEGVKQLADEYARARGVLSFAMSADVVLALLEDGARLDDISKPGATTRVFVHALENKADPATEIVSMAQIPLGPHTTVSTSGTTLREAIDNASTRRARR